MPQIPTKKINNIRLQVIPKDDIPLEHIKGSKLFDRPYRNVLLLANTNSGKTNTLFNILKHSVNPNTGVHIFAGQLANDPSWTFIVNWLNDHNIPVVDETSIYNEDGENQLRELIHDFKLLYLDEYKQNTGQMEEEEPPEPPRHVGFGYVSAQNLTSRNASDSDDELEYIPNHKQKPSKRRQLAPDNVFIFDDLSAEIRNSHDIETLLKECRHYCSQVYILTQYFKDILPAARTNLAYLLLFPNLSLDTLKAVHQDTALAIPLPLFLQLYKDATSEPHHFLYVDIKGGKYRHNFDEEYQIPRTV